MREAHRQGIRGHRHHDVRQRRDARRTGWSTCARIRDLQDETGGFRAFIPWSFQSGNTALEGATEPATGVDYLMTLAVSRLYLDNVPHIQASWVTQGLKMGQVALRFGADDLGSTMIEENVVAATGRDRSGRARTTWSTPSGGAGFTARAAAHRLLAGEGLRRLTRSRPQPTPNAPPFPGRVPHRRGKSRPPGGPGLAGDAKEFPAILVIVERHLAVQSACEQFPLLVYCSPLVVPRPVDPCRRRSPHGSQPPKAVSTSHVRRLA